MIQFIKQTWTIILAASLIATGYHIGCIALGVLGFLVFLADVLVIWRFK